MWKLTVLVILPLIGTCSSFLFGSKGHPWNGLKVTWGVNPFNSYNFADMPRTESHAKSEGWKKISDCGHANFLGKRYMKDSDHLVILIYDVTGNVAGIQAGIPSNLKNGYPSSHMKNHPFVLDGDHQYITAYFVPPSVICTSGRTSAQVQSQGTGSDLYIQNGTNPMTDSMKIAHKESDIAKTKWKIGHCFPAMGVHYWYDVREDMSCDEFYPAFLLYNGGDLNAFGWAFMGDISSPRAEHPPQSSISAFMNPVPKCISTAGTLTTLHIYMNAHPQRDLTCS